ncbi:hypothetical protein [Desulfogranum mediterraneum]|uniref:hypothetical protein n=1 Tax=Desulfogranum mediterraneum TaxID=160661 RepID=UPI000416F09F|nr:hypothetical protein [Desulfogranum mediterraneum]
MNKTAVTVVDAVMGTGKSTWVALKIKEEQSRYVVVLPRLTELERYEELLEGLEGVVSLRDDKEQGKSQSKRELFKEALVDAQVILITHALFENYLTPDTFEIIGEGEWSLIMDEVITAFEPVKGVTDTDIIGLIGKQVMRREPVKGKVARLVPDPGMAACYRAAPATEASKAQKHFVGAAQIKDVYAIENDNGKDFMAFSLREERLNAFKDVIILTYPFKDTDLDYWFQVKGWKVEHMKLTRETKTNSLDDYKLTSHDGQYSGKEFAELIELVNVEQRGVRPHERYGTKPGHFSATDSKKRLVMKKGGNVGKEVQQIRKALRREFRHPKDRSRRVDPGDFMFSCRKECIPVWAEPKNSLSKAFIGRDTWVAFNTRGINDHAHRHHLAFLYNVFPQPEIEKTVQAFDLNYNRDQYALHVLIQWVWRSAIRKGERIRLYLPSDRMRRILLEWLRVPHWGMLEKNVRENRALRCLYI